MFPETEAPLVATPARAAPASESWRAGGGDFLIVKDLPAALVDVKTEPPIRRLATNAQRIEGLLLKDTAASLGSVADGDT